MRESVLILIQESEIIDFKVYSLVEQFLHFLAACLAYLQFTLFPHEFWFIPKVLFYIRNIVLKIVLGFLRSATLFCRGYFYINSDRVFISNPRKAFETALRRAKIKDFSFNTIRNTCMSYLAQMSATLLELKAYGGHKDIKSVERYSHFDPQLTKRTSNLLRAKIYG